MTKWKTLLSWLNTYRLLHDEPPHAFRARRCRERSIETVVRFVWWQEAERSYSLGQRLVVAGVLWHQLSQ